MMSLHRLGPLAEEHYLSQVASGIEDYYSEGREAPGRWLSRSAELLGMDGTVDGDDLRAVLSGNDPDTGAPLHHAANRSTPGWDLTFRSPKSVSLLWGLGDRDIAAQVTEAHRVAEAVAVGYLERTAGFSRTGKNGIHRVEATAFLAAGFDHRTSRDGDPHLHTHVLVSNSVRCADGRWRTIDGKGIYRHKMAASYLYDAELRHQLTARLGVEWEPVARGVAEIVGMDSDLCRQFSKRREAIEDQLAEWGASSGAAAEKAALRTRQTKTTAEPTVMLKARWRSEAEQAGWSIDDDIVSVVDLDRTAVVAIDADETTRALAVLAGPDGVTEQQSTFDRRDVIRHLTGILPAAVGATQLEELADTILAHPDVREVRSTHPEPAFTTVDLLITEARLLADAVRRMDDQCGLVEAALVDRAVKERPSMAEEQADLVRQLCFGGAGRDVVVAPPGTGKTFSLDAARQAWEQAGYRVLGCALSASAAAELQDGAGIPSITIARVHDKLGRGLRLDVDQPRAPTDDRADERRSPRPARRVPRRRPHPSRVRRHRSQGPGLDV
jgi:conjugative relaxase-like TrwC/TraI family protein